MTNYTTAQSHSQSVISSLFKSMYMQMAAALTLTGITAYFLSNSYDFMYFLYEHPGSLWIAMFAQLGVVIWLSARVMRMSMGTATLLYRSDVYNDIPGLRSRNYRLDILRYGGYVLCNEHRGLCH